MIRGYLVREARALARFEGLGLCSAQDDLVVANGSGAAVRADINSQLQALGTLMSGASAPGTTYAHELWADTTAGVIKKRNAGNTNWIVQRTLDESFVLSRASNTMLDVSDIGKTLIATAAFTQTFDAAATLGDGWFVDFLNNSTGNLVLDPNLSETINGAATLTFGPGSSGRIICTGGVFHIVGLRARKFGSFTRDLSSASGVQTITGVGFEVRKLTFFGGITTTSCMSFAIDDGTSHFGIGDLNIASAGTWAINNTFALYLLTGSGAYQTGYVTARAGDGFSITWDKVGSPSGTAVIHYLGEA